MGGQDYNALLEIRTAAGPGWTKWKLSHRRHRPRGRRRNRNYETVAFTLDGVAYEIHLSTKNAKETPRRVAALDRGRTACRGKAPKLDRRREQDSDRATRVRSHPRVGA
jgi:hypothetical protein